MPCPIQIFCERKTDTGYKCLPKITPFNWQFNDMYAFMAAVRYNLAPPTIACSRGLPVDASSAAVIYNLIKKDSRLPSWLLISELLEWDYAAVVRQGSKMTWREFLGDDFMEDLLDMEKAGVDRIVFWV